MNASSISHVIVLSETSLWNRLNITDSLLKTSVISEIYVNSTGFDPTNT